MTREFTLQGLDCQDNITQIESAVKKIVGVESALVNLMTTSLTIITYIHCRAYLYEAVKHTVHKYEPYVVVREETDNGINNGCRLQKKSKTRLFQNMIFQKWRKGL
jgi:cation transport ATPase